MKMAGSDTTVSTAPIAVFGRWLATGVTLINLALIGVVALSLQQSRNQYEETAAATARNLSRLLAESVMGDVEKIDVLLLGVVDEIERQTAGGGIDGPALNVFLARQQARLPEIISLRTLDADGIVTYGRGVAPRAHQDNSDREYYFRQRDNPQVGLVIAKPVFTRLDRKWAIPLSRPIRRPDGSFGGVVYVNVALAHLTRLFSTIDVGRGGSVSLRDSELRILARYPLPPHLEKVIGETLDVPPLRELIAAGRETGTYITNRTTDGVERKFAVRRVSGFPLYIAFGQSTGEYLAPWRDQALKTLALVVLFALLTLISSWLLLRAWQRRDSAMAALLAERAALGQAYAYNRSLIEASLDPLVTIGADGKITDVNSATETATGQTRDILIGTEFSDYFSDPDKARAGYRQVFQEGIVRDYALEIRHRDGHLTPVLYNAVVYRDAAGQVTGVFAAARDVTERKRAEEDLRKSEARFREALGHAPIGMAITSPEGRFIEVNRALCRVVGYAAEELLERGFEQITYPGDLQNDLDHLRRLESGEIDYYEIEKRYVRKDGNVVWAQLTASLIRDEQGKPLQIIKQIQDVTQRKLAEEEVRRLNEELEQRVEQRTALLAAANRELEEFSYSISHDMRTPLRAIDGFSQMLLEEYGGNLDTEGRRQLKVVRDNAQRMGRLIDDIVRFLNMGKRKIECSSFDIARLAREVFEELRAAQPTRRLRLEMGELPAAWGDREMVGQALRNLLANAIKFSPARTDAETVIEVGGVAKEEENTYYVKDRGVGFDMRYSGKLFKVFERVHPTGQYEGTGIGLAIVKRIVERHGGRVWAQAEVDAGATFHFSLPNRRK